MGRQAQRLLGHGGIARAQGHRVAPSPHGVLGGIAQAHPHPRNPQQGQCQQGPQRIHDGRREALLLGQFQLLLQLRGGRTVFGGLRAQGGGLGLQRFQLLAVLEQGFRLRVQRLPQRNGLRALHRHFLGRRDHEFGAGTQRNRAVQPDVQRLQHQAGALGGRGARRQGLGGGRCTCSRPRRGRGRRPGHDGRPGYRGLARGLLIGRGWYCAAVWCCRRGPGGLAPSGSGQARQIHRQRRRRARGNGREVREKCVCACGFARTPGREGYGEHRFIQRNGCHDPHARWAAPHFRQRDDTHLAVANRVVARHQLRRDAGRRDIGARVGLQFKRQIDRRSQHHRAAATAQRQRRSTGCKRPQPRPKNSVTDFHNKFCSWSEAFLHTSPR